MNDLLRQILEYLEPDQDKWAYWMSRQELFGISDAECIRDFVFRIHKAKEERKKVIVCGDYDCDGILATTIMVDGLQKFGLETGFYIPDRIREGYGLHAQTVELAARKGYEVLITVDNGVKSEEALKLAKEYEMEVIVSDHHMTDGNVLCDLLVHPDRMEPEFSSLCGAGVAYECIRALCADTDFHLMLAGVASVGDVMSVTGQTRALIQNGLHLLNQSREKHLFPLANDANVNETSVAFQIVPKLNAIGRLSNLANVNNAVRYFLSDDDRELSRFRSQLDHINDLRKQMSTAMKERALEKCVTQDAVLLACDASFHEGIIGLVAGALCSMYQKPAIVMTQNPEGYKASMRSPEGFDCMEFLEPFHDFQALGGHVNAAGFSLDHRSYSAFVQYVRQTGNRFEWTPVSKDPLIVPVSQIDLESVESLDVLRPFGPGFTLPLLYIEDVFVRSIFDLSNGRHRKFTLDTGLACMYFNIPAFEKEKSVNSIRGFIGSPQISTYRGKKQVSFIIEQVVYK